MYSEELKKAKVKCNIGTRVSKEVIINAIKNFAEPDDLVQVPQKALFELFDKYCDENSIPKAHHRMVGKVIRELYGFKSCTVRENGEVVKIYIK